MKDEAAGEVPVAFVVRSNACIDTTQDEIKHFISKQVPLFLINALLLHCNNYTVYTRSLSEMCRWCFTKE